MTNSNYIQPTQHPSYTPAPTVGDTVICDETKKPFIVARTNDGLTFNYATDTEGRILSDEGVDIREKRDLLKFHSQHRPFFCYVASDRRSVTGWKGNILGTITRCTSGRVGFCRDGLYVRVTDVHGQHWYGKNSGASMYIILRPVTSKSKSKSKSQQTCTL